jgi:hypothetical protein
MHTGCLYTNIYEFTCMLQAAMCEMTVTTFERSFKLRQTLHALQAVFHLLLLLLLRFIFWQQTLAAHQLMGP